METKKKISMIKEEIEACGGFSITLPDSIFKFKEGEKVRIKDPNRISDENYICYIGDIIFSLANTNLSVNTYGVNIRGEIKWFEESVIEKI